MSLIPFAPFLDFARNDKVPSSKKQRGHPEPFGFVQDRLCEDLALGPRARGGFWQSSQLGPLTPKAFGVRDDRLRI
jgi:hypothetical protein